MFKDGAIYRVRKLVLSHTNGSHAFHEKYHDEAKQNWHNEITKKPELFDGKVMLFDDINLSNGELKGSCYSTPYSSFILWHKHQDQIGYHVFGLGVLVTDDGGVLLGQMAPHTYHAGRILSPAGSLDDHDVVGGLIDIKANIAREIGEETGLTDVDYEIEEEAHLFVQGRILVCVYRCLCHGSSVEICDKANRFIQNDPEAELTRVFVVENAQDLGDQIAPFMPPILDWHFKTVMQ